MLQHLFLVTLAGDNPLEITPLATFVLREKSRTQYQCGEDREHAPRLGHAPFPVEELIREGHRSCSRGPQETSLGPRVHASQAIAA